MIGHTLEKTHFATDLSPGMEVADLFLLATAQQARAKNGPYWRLEFRDATGSIGGKIWSPQSQNYPDLSPGMFMVRGRVTSYRDQPEIAVESLVPLTDMEAATLDLSLFMPASARPPHEMLEELKRLAASVLTHEPWRRFVAAVLEHPEIGPALLAAPAAKSMHHAFAGGLLEHTLSICRLCMRLCDHYPGLDRQVLFAGALCHDMGKLWELSAGLVADYTTKGRLIGHISLALEELGPLMREAGLDQETADHLRHLILSHHGTREFGSPVLPATAEAITLHYADNLDAKLNQVESILGAALGDAEAGWSAYVPALERTLYRAPRTPEDAEPTRAAVPLSRDGELSEEISSATDAGPAIGKDDALLVEFAPEPAEATFSPDVFDDGNAPFDAFSAEAMGDDPLPIEEFPPPPPADDDDFLFAEDAAPDGDAPFEVEPLAEFSPPDDFGCDAEECPDAPPPPGTDAPELPPASGRSSSDDAETEHHSGSEVDVATTRHTVPELAFQAEPDPEPRAEPKPGKKSTAKTVAKPLPLFE